MALPLSPFEITDDHGAGHRFGGIEVHEPAAVGGEEGVEAELRAEGDLRAIAAQRVEA